MFFYYVEWGSKNRPFKFRTFWRLVFEWSRFQMVRSIVISIAIVPTIWKLDEGWPFKIRTCPVFGSPLYFVRSLGILLFVVFVHSILNFEAFCIEVELYVVVRRFIWKWHCHRDVTLIILFDWIVIAWWQIILKQ